MPNNNPGAVSLFAVKARAYLRNKFKTGAKPTEIDFANVFESFWHKTEDKIPVDRISGLDAVGGKITEAITVAGVGRLGNLSDGDVIAKNTSLTDFVRSLVSRRILYVYRACTAALSGNPATLYGERGSQLAAVTVTVNYTQNDAGAMGTPVVNFEGNPVALNPDNRSATVANFVFKPYPRTFDASAPYAAGPVRNDTLGTPTPGSIAAGTVNAGTLTYSPVLPWFYGSSLTANITGAMVYAGNKAVATVGTALDVPTFGTDGFLWFAVPAGSKVFTQWYRTALNKGAIGAASDLFGGRTTVLVPSSGLAEDWAENYDLYATNYITGGAAPMQLS